MYADIVALAKYNEDYACPDHFGVQFIEEKVILCLEETQNDVEKTDDGAGGEQCAEYAEPLELFMYFVLGGVFFIHVD